jgi:hypothetical protein
MLAHNKKIKFARFAGWDANTQGRFASMPYVPAPQSLALCAIANAESFRDRIRKMFKNHNALTILLVICVLVNGVVAVFNSQNIILGLINFSTLAETIYWLVSLIIIVFSILGGILVVKKKQLGLKICLWVYVLQLIGVITSSHNYGLIVGVSVAWSIDLEGSSLDINLVALAVVVLSSISLSNVGKTPQNENCT